MARVSSGFKGSVLRQSIEQIEEAVRIYLSHGSGVQRLAAFAPEIHDQGAERTGSGRVHADMGQARADQRRVDDEGKRERVVQSVCDAHAVTAATGTPRVPMNPMTRRQLAV
jgi:hypothetical protein